MFFGLRDINVNEAWRCLSCKRLMYNLDPRGYPCSGAPIPLYLNEDYPEICGVCYEMHRALDTADKTYWRNLPTARTTKVNGDPIHTHC